MNAEQFDMEYAQSPEQSSWIAQAMVGTFVHIQFFELTFAL